MSKDINTAPFKAGDEVICIKSIIGAGGSIKKGEIFKVRELFKCDCGWSIDIGFKNLGPSHCRDCGKFICTDKNPAWAKFFRRIEYKSAISEILEKYPISERIETDIEIKEHCK